MRFSIAKEFTFAASHQLRGLPENHKCARLHGHNYRLIVELAGDLDAVGFVRDYGDLETVTDFIARVDHRNLNDLFEANPTAENLAAIAFNACSPSMPELVAVRVCETPGTWAEFRF